MTGSVGSELNMGNFEGGPRRSKLALDLGGSLMLNESIRLKPFVGVKQMVVFE